MDESCQFFGLPGNPVSAFVTFALVVRPTLLALQGATTASPHSFPVRSGFSRDKGGPRQEYLRAVLEHGPEGLVATPLRESELGHCSLAQSERRIADRASQCGRYSGRDLTVYSIFRIGSLGSDGQQCDRAVSPPKYSSWIRTAPRCLREYESHQCSRLPKKPRQW